MSPQTLRSFRHLEGHHVSVSLGDGSRLDDCELVSAGRGHNATLWLHDGQDELRKDNAALEQEKVHLWETMQRLGQYIYIAQHLGYRTLEIPVRWNDVAGTKVSMTGGLAAFLDPVKVRWNGMRGRYK